MTGAGDRTLLDRIIMAAFLATIAQDALRHALRAGVTGAELLEAAGSAIEAVGGSAAETAMDLRSGEQTALIEGPYVGRRLEAGDPVIFDVVAHHDGAWAGSCNTLCCGTPNTEMVRRHDAVRRALKAGIAAARAGVAAGEVDAAMRATLHSEGLKCPHPTGHAVGSAARQAPLLLPGERTPLKEGVTVALGPGAYGDGFGVRLKHLVLIEAEGPVALTGHSLSL